MEYYEILKNYPSFTIKVNTKCCFYERTETDENNLPWLLTPKTSLDYISITSI